jgi:hypothetical protein
MKTSIIKNVVYAITRKLFFFGVSLVFTAVISCSQEDASVSDAVNEQETVTSESQENFYFEDGDEIAEEAFISEDAKASGGKVAVDTRLSGAVLFHVGTVTNGSLHIDFGLGCKDLDGNIRKGIIIIDHIGRWNEEGAEWTIIFSGYTVNGVHIEGTRKIKVVSATETLIVRDVELVDGKITWPDGTFATRDAHHRREHERNENPSLKRLIVYGSATGTLRNGRDYYIEILEPLVYDRACAESGVFIAVKGKKLVKHSNREVTIDYGNGTCDNIVTITTKAGATFTYEVNK